MRFSIALAAGLLALSSVADAQTFKSSAGGLKVETVVGGLGASVGAARSCPTAACW